MLKPYLSRAALALVTSTMMLPLVNSVQAGETSNLELSGMYRVETNDCPGCGPMRIFSEADFAPAMQAAREAAARSADARLNRFNGNSIEFNDQAARLLARLGTQVVFLNFDVGGEPTFPVCFIDENNEPTGELFGIFNDHIYTQQERDDIQARIEQDYAQFNLVFTQERPSFGEFTTVDFGDNDAAADCSEGSNISLTESGAVSVLFGRADNIDFGNRVKDNIAFADASIWEFFAQLGDGSNFELFANVDVDDDFGGDIQAAISFAVIGQSANTGAHELGHVLGLRHQNSFGAPGDGLPNTGRISPFDFVPVFDGPADASETILHTMASGASVGLPFDGGVNLDRFLSERSATRLAVNEALSRSSSLLLTEEATQNRDGRVSLRRLIVPNTIVEGKNKDAFLDVKARIVDGNISTFGETDSYFFRGRKGDFFNAEIVPIFAKGQSFEEGIIGQLRVFLQNRDGTETLIGFNVRSFESVFDTEVFDIVLPENGRYRVKITAPDEVFIEDIDGDGVIDSIPLTEVDAPELLTGNYEVLMFTCNKRILDTDVAQRMSEVRARLRSRFPDHFGG